MFDFITSREIILISTVAIVVICVSIYNTYNKYVLIIIPLF